MLDQSDLDLVLSSIPNDPNNQACRQLGRAPSSVWIGSGLAKIPAFYGAAVLQKTGAPSRFMTALDYVAHPLIASLPVLVSLRGNHRDAVAVARSVVSRRCEHAILLTGDLDGQAGSLLREASTGYLRISAPLPARDKRFVNCKGIFMLSLLSHRLATGGLADPSSAQLHHAALESAWTRAGESAIRFGEWLKKSGADSPEPLIVLASGMSSELSIAWQAVLSEAGVITPICLDIKDYTHGDHAAASRTGRARYVVLSHAGIEDICRRFAERFSLLYDVFTVNLGSDPAHLFWENLFTACNATSVWTALLGYPNQRPPRHAVVSSWRDWGELPD